VTTPHLILVRHPPVPASSRGICYGASDILLDEAGLAAADRLVEQLVARLSPVEASCDSIALYHSGLDRSAQVANRLETRLREPVAGREPVTARVDTRLRERDFGAWELQAWDDIHARTGDAMNGMLTDPEHWSPPGGETTYQLRDRVVAWHRHVCDTLEPGVETVVTITHGGPIAALLGTLRGLPVADWLALIPPPGTWVETPLSG
jgi:broad specificity phosphatase PhoE